MSTTPPSQHNTAGVDLDRPVRLYDLAFLDEGDEITVGRQDIDSYAIFPPDGAALLRKLAGGLSPNEAARWYAATYGEQVDIDEFMAALSELHFLRTEDSVAPAAPVRWTRLGRAAFSPVAWACYAAVTAWCVVLMVRSPDLAPAYHNLFFSRYLTLVQLVLLACQVPLVLVHESFHALAGRRLGLRSRLSVGTRLIYVVLETSLDGLVTVPRRRRYLPMLAGMVVDVVVFSALTVVADLTRRPDGGLSAVGRVCLALAFTTVLRLAWQFFFYLQTDLYHVVCTTLGCVDLQTAARRTLRNRFNRLRRRPDLVLDESTWHPRDRAVARWYSWLMLVGYSVSVGVFALAAAPAAYTFLARVVARFTHSTSGAELGDSLAFVLSNLCQLGLIVWLTVRGRRRRTAAQHLLS